MNNETVTSQQPQATTFDPADYVQRQAKAGGLDRLYTNIHDGTEITEEVWHTEMVQLRDKQVHDRLGDLPAGTAFKTAIIKGEQDTALFDLDTYGYFPGADKRQRLKGLSATLSVPEIGRRIEINRQLKETTEALGALADIKSVAKGYKNIVEGAQTVIDGRLASKLTPGSAPSAQKLTRDGARQMGEGAFDIGTAAANIPTNPLSATLTALNFGAQAGELNHQRVLTHKLGTSESPPDEPSFPNLSSIIESARNAVEAMGTTRSKEIETAARRTLAITKIAASAMKQSTPTNTQVDGQVLRTTAARFHDREDMATAPIDDVATHVANALGPREADGFARALGMTAKETESFRRTGSIPKAVSDRIEKEARELGAGPSESSIHIMRRTGRDIMNVKEQTANLLSDLGLTASPHRISKVVRDLSVTGSPFGAAPSLAVRELISGGHASPINSPDENQAEIATQVQTTAPTETTETYTIKPGDTLFEISRRTGVPMDVIARQNGIPDLNKIQAGAVVNIDPAMRQDLPAKGLTPEERKALNAPAAEALARRALKLGGVTAPPKDALPAEIGRLMAQGYGLLEAADMAARYFSTPKQAVPEADLQVAAATVGVPDQAIKDVLTPEEVVQQQTIYHERPNSPEAAAALAKVAAAFAAAEAISPGYTSYKTDAKLQKAMNMDSNFRADMDAIARSIGITEKKGALGTYDLGQKKAIIREADRIVQGRTAEQRAQERADEVRQETQAFVDRMKRQLAVNRNTTFDLSTKGYQAVVKGTNLQTAMNASSTFRADVEKTAKALGMTNKEGFLGTTWSGAQQQRLNAEIARNNQGLASAQRQAERAAKAAAAKQAKAEADRIQGFQDAYAKEKRKADQETERQTQATFKAQVKAEAERERALHATIAREEPSEKDVALFHPTELDPGFGSGLPQQAKKGDSIFGPLEDAGGNSLMARSSPEAYQVVAARQKIKDDYSATNQNSVKARNIELAKTGDFGAFGTDSRATATSSAQLGGMTSAANNNSKVRADINSMAKSLGITGRGLGIGGLDAKQLSAVRDGLARETPAQRAARDRKDAAANGGGGDGGGASPRVICTELVAQGLMDARLQQLDQVFSIARLTPAHVRGYHLWAIPFVRLMRKHPWLTKVTAPLANWRAEELAYQLGNRPRSSLPGKLVRWIGEPVCWLLGQFVGEQRPEVLYG